MYTHDASVVEAMHESIYERVHLFCALIYT